MRSGDLSKGCRIEAHHESGREGSQHPVGIPWLGAFAMKSSAISSASAASSSNVLVQYRIVQCCIATPVIHVHKQKHSKYHTKLLFQDAIL